MPADRRRRRAAGDRGPLRRAQRRRDGAGGERARRLPLAWPPGGRRGRGRPGQGEEGHAHPRRPGTRHRRASGPRGPARPPWTCVSWTGRPQRQAGVRGVLLTARRRPVQGTAELTVDYASFASVIGGDSAGRLSLTRLPACALTTPESGRLPGRQPARHPQRRHGAAAVGGGLLPGGPARRGGGRRPVVRWPSPLPAPEQSAGGAETSPPPRSPPPRPGRRAARPAAFTWSYPMDGPPPPPDLSPPWTSPTTPGPSTAATPRRTTRADRRRRGLRALRGVVHRPAVRLVRQGRPQQAGTTCAGSTTTPPSSSTARRPNWSRTTPPAPGG
ncbi:hypothetical protein STENM327S_02332 [Streptomyces tendae]